MEDKLKERFKLTLQDHLQPAISCRECGGAVDDLTIDQIIEDLLLDVSKSILQVSGRI